MESLVILAVILLITSVVFGIWTGFKGEPYGFGPFTVHKLSGMGFVILTMIVAVNGLGSGIFGVPHLVFALAFGVSIISLFSTGAIMSARKMTTPLRAVHITSSVVSVVSGGVLLLSLV